MRRATDPALFLETARQAAGWLMATVLAMSVVAAAWLLPNLARTTPIDPYIPAALQREGGEGPMAPPEPPIDFPHRGMSLNEVRTLPGIATGSAVRAAAVSEGTDPKWDLTVSDYVLLGRWLAVDDLLSELTDKYGLDYIWTGLALLSESALDPLAQGPQADDRGLGQVGYWAEEAGQRWGLDPLGPYFNPGIDPRASVWKPEKNLVLASIVMRWVYSNEAVRRPDEAYGVYTYGGLAVGSSGSIHPAAQVRMDRAKSYLPVLNNFVAMKASASRPESGQVAALLAIDRTCVDGMDCYEKIRNYYLELMRKTDNGWLAVLLGRDCLTFSDLLSNQYGIPQSVGYSALHRELKEWARIGTSGELGQAYTNLVKEVARRSE